MQYKLYSPRDSARSRRRTHPRRGRHTETCTYHVRAISSIACRAVGYALPIVGAGPFEHRTAMERPLFHLGGVVGIKVNASDRMGEDGPIFHVISYDNIAAWSHDCPTCLRIFERICIFSRSSKWRVNESQWSLQRPFAQRIQYRMTESPDGRKKKSTFQTHRSRKILRNNGKLAGKSLAPLWCSRGFPSV